MAQRGEHLEGGIHGLGGGVVEREVMGSDLGGHRKPLCPSGAHQLDSDRRGEMLHVITRPGEPRQRQVAGNDDLLGHCGHTPQPQPGRHVTLVHVPSGGQPRIQGVLGHHPAQLPQVLHRSS